MLEIKIKKMKRILGKIFTIILGFLLISTIFSLINPLNEKYIPITIGFTHGKSMSPTFGDFTFAIDKGAVYTNEVKRGDIVGCLSKKNDSNDRIIKRIVGLPNETIELKNGVTYINGKPLDEPYLSEEYNKLKRDFGPTVLGDNEYYVIGDNRDNSLDSRFWGAISREDIFGVYFFHINLIK